MDKVQFFDKSHYSQIQEWFTARGLPCPNKSHLPFNGFIVPEVAAGFLYLTDSEIAILDGFITNPSSNKFLVLKAINEIVESLTELASDMGSSLVICNTELRSIKNRAIALGFSQTGEFTSFAKELN